MIGKWKVIYDVDCGVYEELWPVADIFFYDFSQAKEYGIENSIIIVGDNQFYKHREELLRVAAQKNNIVFFSHPHEGSASTTWKLGKMSLTELAESRKIYLISGSETSNKFCSIDYEYYLRETTRNAGMMDEYYHKFLSTPRKPYKFLFLNGWARRQRRWLIEKLEFSGLLNHALWTMHSITFSPDSDSGSMIQFNYNGIDYMHRDRPSRTLSDEYELAEIADKTYDYAVWNSAEYYNVFNPSNMQAIVPKQYIDTYFSLVTETLFHTPPDDSFPFLTEKIWKPILFGHPWVCASVPRYYQKLHNKGFRSFGKWIDESFDLIDDHSERLFRLSNAVEDLCRQDLAKFMSETKEICEHNRNLAYELAEKNKIEFPERFIKFIHQIEQQDNKCPNVD